MDPGRARSPMTHRGTFGFPLTGHDDLLREALATMLSARVRERVEAGLGAAMQALREANPQLEFPEELRVLITLGDPTDDHFMNEIQGLSAFGGIAGFIELTLWPNPSVLEVSWNGWRRSSHTSCTTTSDTGTVGSSGTP